jgi:hypothetical protein
MRYIGDSLHSLKEALGMKQCCQVVLVSPVCLLIATQANAAEIREVEIMEGHAQPLTRYSPLDCCSETVYDNQGGNIYLTGPPRSNLLDDGSFPPGTAPITVWGGVKALYR